MSANIALLPLSTDEIFKLVRRQIKAKKLKTATLSTRAGCFYFYLRLDKDTTITVAMYLDGRMSMSYTSRLAGKEHVIWFSKQERQALAPSLVQL